MSLLETYRLLSEGPQEAFPMGFSWRGSPSGLAQLHCPFQDTTMPLQDTHNASVPWLFLQQFVLQPLTTFRCLLVLLSPAGLFATCTYIYIRLLSTSIPTRRASNNVQDPTAVLFALLPWALPESPHRQWSLSLSLSHSYFQACTGLCHAAFYTHFSCEVLTEF
jgi:hypothetical protein